MPGLSRGLLTALYEHFGKGVTGNRAHFGRAAHRGFAPRGNLGQKD